MRQDTEKRVSPRIKICGLTDKREAEYLNEMSVDYAGFVFYPPSKRYVTIECAARIAEHIDTQIKKVAVLVSPTPEQVAELQESGFIDILQIHKEMRSDTIEMAKLPVWRAMNVANLSGGRGGVIAEAISDLPEGSRTKVKAVLVDAPDFGSGRTFDWGGGYAASDTTVAGDVCGDDVSFILAGGLNAGNVARGIKIFRPDIVDVSSGVEGEHGKVRELISEFVAAVRKTASEF